mmetsp:Transcript_10413/g.11944  ORF Transcript_10413/g.11944 Transcript_10413/m.11944 type:complete len:207 (+) Transcript_10413:102-722(+)
MSSSKLRLVALLGSTRAKRANDAVANFVLSRVQKNGDFENVVVLDPRDSESGFFNKLMDKAYFHYKPGEGDHPPKELERVASQLRDADCFLVITPEYNHSVSPSLSNMMNYFGSSVYSYKASGVATYSAGNWGGTRSGVALRPFLSELGCLPVSAQAHFPTVWRKMSNGELNPDEVHIKMTDNMLKQLSWHANAMKSFTEQCGLPK